MSHNMKLGRPTKVLIGFATVWVAIYPILAIISLRDALSGIGGMVGYVDPYGTPKILPAFITSLVLNGPTLQITGLLYFALVGFYVSHISRNTGTSTAARVIWGIGVIFLPFIAMPAYYLRYILREDDRRFPTTLLVPVITVLLVLMVALVTLLTTAIPNDTAQVPDVAPLEEIAVLRIHADSITDAAFSSDGARILTRSWLGTVRVWDAATGAEVAMLGGPENEISAALLSPDGARIVTWEHDGATRVRDVATGATVAVLRSPEAAVWVAASSPDGARVLVVSAPDFTARVWDVATGTDVVVLRVPDGVSMAVFSPDGTRLVTASAGTARVWDVATGAEVAVLPGYESEFNAIIDAAFSPDGARVVTTSGQGTVEVMAQVWDVATGMEIAMRHADADLVGTAVFSPDGARILTASADGTARVWDAATGAELAVLREAGTGMFSPDGTRIVTTEGVWDAATGAQLAVLPAPESWVSKVAFSPDWARIVTVNGDGTARVWDATKIEPLH